MMGILVFALGLVVAPTAGAQEPPLKLLLDTDIGADIDDEMTLIYLLNSPEIDLRGVTTVHGNPCSRADSARAIIDVIERSGEVPVYAGAAKKLAQQPGMTDASRFIVQSLREANGPRNIVVTGAYTNVARAVQEEPKLARSRLETIYLMGFSLATMSTLHNATNDLQATGILLKSGIPLRVLPAEIGWECQMTQEEYDEILASEAPQIVHIKQRMMNWVKRVRTRPSNPIPDYLPRPYDTLAAMTIKNPELFQWKRGTIEIVSSGGKLTFIESPNKLHEIVVGVDREKAMALHHHRLLAWPGTLTTANSFPPGFNL
jgi:purine nucleosidase